MSDTRRNELVDVIRQVRSRWRTKLMMRGGVAVVLGALIALVIASWGLQTYKFSPQSVTGFRIGVFVVFAALIVAWFVMPLRRRVSDTQVALYVEEHDKTLQAAILSAVEAQAAVKAGTNEVPALRIAK